MRVPKLNLTDVKKCEKKKTDKYGKGWPLLDASPSTKIFVSTNLNLIIC